MAGRGIGIGIRGAAKGGGRGGGGGGWVGGRGGGGGLGGGHAPPPARSEFHSFQLMPKPNVLLQHAWLPGRSPGPHWGLLRPHTSSWSFRRPAATSTFVCLPPPPPPLLIKILAAHPMLQCAGLSHGVAAPGGVPGVLAPLDQAPRTTKIDFYKYKWWHICSFTSH